MSEREPSKAQVKARRAVLLAAENTPGWETASEHTRGIVWGMSAAIRWLLDSYTFAEYDPLNVLKSMGLYRDETEHEKRVGHERQGTAYDPDATGHELQGRDGEPDS